MKAIVRLIGLVSWAVLSLGSAAFAQCIGTFPYVQDFENSAGGWTAGTVTPNGLGPSSWVWANPVNKPVINSAASGTKCWFTGNNGNLFPPLEPWSYVPNEFSGVTSPCFDFSSLLNPGIKVKIWWECQFSLDGVVLLSSKDNGVTWQRVGGYLDPIYWYNDNTINGGVNGGPGGQQIGWTGTVSDGAGSAGWVGAQHALTGLAGEPNVKLRFAFSSDASSGAVSLADGFAFDDVTIADMPYVELGPDTVICFADTVFLDACAPSAIEYQWNTSPIDTFCNRIAVSSGQYVVTVTDTLGFIFKDTFNLVVSPTFINLPNAALICPGDTLSLDAGNAGSNYLWLPGGQTTQTIDVSATDVYQVIISDNFGCQETDSISVAVDVVPVVDLGPDSTICAGQSLVLDAGSGNPGITYAWTPTSAQTQTVFVSAPGEYKVVVTTAAGCVTGDSVNIDVALAPVVNLGPNRIECGTFQLDANNPGATYLWSTGATTQTISSSTGGTYWVAVTNSVGCVNRDTVVITSGQAPVVNLGVNNILCGGAPVTLTAGTLIGQTYLWSTAQTTPAISVNIPGTYIVSVTGANGCVTRDTAVVTLSTLSVNLGPNRTLCQGDQLVLNAGNNASAYQWSTGSQASSITVSSGGTYIVTVSDLGGCQLRDTVVVTMKPDFVANFTTTPAVLYSPVQFTNQSNAPTTSWNWTFGDGTSSTLQNPVHTYQALGAFTVCMTASDGICTNTICRELVVNIFQGIGDELAQSLEIYPNPAQDQVHITFDLQAPADVNLTLTDLAGRAVRTLTPGRVSAWEGTLERGDLAPGLYLLKVSADDAVIFRKIWLQ
ncbi:MAG: PKD domain-containing protein [Bacteroidia bacterium]|nr:PKD domain-containing protein [Bacteroidia bacterium]